MLRSEYDPMGHAIAEFHSTGKAEKLLVESDLCETDEISVPYLFRNFRFMDRNRVIQEASLKVMI